MGLQTLADDASANVHKHPRPQTSAFADGRKPYFSSVWQNGSDEYRHTVHIHPIPHRGERRKDRAVSAQCAGTALSADSSAGIYA